MRGPGRGLLAVALISLGLLGWLYGGEVRDHFRALGSPVAAFSEPPGLWFALLVLLAAAAAVGVFGVGLAQRRGPEFRGYRLLPIVALVSLFLDLFALSGSKVPIGSSDQLGMTLQVLAQQVQALATGDGLPAEPAALGPLVASLGPPPYLSHGQPLERYSLQLRTGCDGPLTAAPGAAAGTLLYCLSPDRRTAWLGAVALPAEERFGPPAVFTRAGRVQVAILGAPPPAEAQEDSADGG